MKNMRKIKILTYTLTSMESEGSPGIDLPATLGECCTILYADLKEETTYVAEDGNFKVLYETDGAKKYDDVESDSVWALQPWPNYLRCRCL
jgi:hypothetical protein